MKRPPTARDASAPPGARAARREGSPSRSFHTQRARDIALWSTRNTHSFRPCRMATAWASPSRWYLPSTKQGDIGSPLASGDEPWRESSSPVSDSGNGELVPIHCSSPDSAARFQEMMRLASEKALLEKRFSEHTRSAELARANALERETALVEKANEDAAAVNTAMAQVQQELERERHAREELSRRALMLKEAVTTSELTLKETIAASELKLKETIAASAAEKALLR